MTIIQRVPWRVQPQFAVGINVGNPLTTSLVDVLPAWQKRTVNGAVATTTGAVVDGVNTDGKSRRIESAANVRDTYTGRWSGISAPQSVLAFYRLNATPGGSSRLFSNFTNASGGWTVAPNNVNYRLIIGTSGGNVTLTGNAIATGRKIDVFTTTGTSSEYWENGVLTASNTSHAAMGTSPASIRVGSDGSANGVAGDFYLFAVWERVLSEGEIKSLAANPWQLFAPLPRRIWAPAAAAGDVTQALTNNLATTSSGILVPALSLATTGNAATASAGTPVAAISIALTGNAATASVGTPVAALSLAVAGNAGTASVGTATPALSLATTGNTATTAAGTPVAALSLALSGNAATASAGTVAVPGVIVPTANEAVASSGTVSPGITIALTGNAATASAGSVSPAIALALSGLAGTSSAGIVVPGLSLAISGNAATASAGNATPATGDITVALSGNSATANVGLLVVGGIRYPSLSRHIYSQRLTRSIKPERITRSIKP